jgi:hypothetical protein
MKKISVVMFALSLFAFTGCGKDNGSNIQIEGVKGPNISLMQDQLLISMVFENVQLDGGLRYVIPKYKYSYLEISPDLQSSGTLMNVSIGLKDLIDGNLDMLDPQKLPGGRNLPGVASGSLPAVAFSIEKFNNMTVYAGKEVFGLFIPAKVGVDGAIASFRYYVGDKKAGTISLIGRDENGENDGILLLLDMKGQVKSQLMKVYKKYNK